MTANSNTVPKLGFGCMRFPLTDPKDVTAIDIDQVKEMVDLWMPAARISIPLSSTMTGTPR